MFYKKCFIKILSSFLNAQLPRKRDSGASALGGLKLGLRMADSCRRNDSAFFVLGFKKKVWLASKFWIDLLEEHIAVSILYEKNTAAPYYCLVIFFLVKLVYFSKRALCKVTIKT
jgi:hypothetical protein